MKKNKHGIAVMRLQPLHWGHTRIIERMISECEYVTILIGSKQESNNEKNPFNYFTRRRMLKNVFPTQINVLGLDDINNPSAWSKYVLGTVVSVGDDRPIPDAYYAGSEEDASLFYNTPLNVIIENRNDLSATKVRDSINSGTNEWCDWIPEINHPIIENYIRRINEKLV